MPYSRMIYKAGKIGFLLVCLCFCTGCRDQKAVFQAGEAPDPVVESLIEEEPEQTEQEEKTETVQENPVSQLVNINTADAALLMTLPGIGQTRASDIIAYRETVAKFEKIEDIMNVKGIKTGVFNKIKSLICVK